jgi:hypothetical protein
MVRLSALTTQPVTLGRRFKSSAWWEFKKTFASVLYFLQITFVDKKQNPMSLLVVKPLGVARRAR